MLNIQQHVWRIPNEVRQFFQEYVQLRQGLDVYAASEFLNDPIDHRYVGTYYLRKRCHGTLMCYKKKKQTIYNKKKPDD